MIKNGSDQPEKLAFLKGKKLGLLTNPSGVNATLHSTAELLHKEFQLEVVLGPEHGFRGDQQAGVSITSTGLDPILGIRSYSLHGETRRPTQEMLEGIDAMVYDIQDIGARFYTYLYSLAYTMEECAKRNIPVIILDRFNPLNGVTLEGCRILPKLSCFVGDYGLAARYGLTIGEFANYFNKKYAVGCELTVIPCSGWKRDMLYPETGLPWVMPSPNIPTWESALTYIGTCIFEGTNLSEGRGTCHPFEIIGAPFVDAERLAMAMEKRNCPGVLFRPLHFEPTFGKYAKELCHGVQLHITEARTYRPFETGLWLLDEFRRQCPELTYRAEHFNNILGDDALLTGRMDIPDFIEYARQESREFARETEEFKLY